MITDRIDSITRIPASRLAERIDPPRSVKIELTGRCNYRCSFCALAVRAKQPTGDMDFGLFKRITREMRESGVEEIGVFFLGESFMAPDLLIRAVDYLKSTLGMPYVFCTSNGSMATPGVLEDVMRAGLDSLKWSMNSTPDEFESIMKVKSKLFRRALANVKAAHEIRARIGAKTGLYASSIQYDGEQQAKMESFLAEHVRPYVDQHYWLPLYSMGSFSAERTQALGYAPTAGNQGRVGALRDPLPCWSVFTEGHVTSSGMLSACCFDASDTWAMSDLNTTSFVDGWNSAKFMALRAAHLKRAVGDTACAKCVAYQGA